VNFSNLVFERYTDISLSKNNGTELYTAKSFEKEHFCKEAEILLLDEVGDPENLEDEFDSAIASRIVDLCIYVDFSGLPDMRMKM